MCVVCDVIGCIYGSLSPPLASYLKSKRVSFGYCTFEFDCLKSHMTSVISTSNVHFPTQALPRILFLCREFDAKYRFELYFQSQVLPKLAARFTRNA
jgi:hypothetical protein